MSAEQNVTEVPVHPASQTSDEESFGGSGGYELDEDGQRISHGMGQSKSSRRRRRKRKGKGSDAAAAGQASGQPNGAGEPGVVNSVQGSAEAQAAPQAQGFVPGGQQGFRQQNGQGRGFQSNGNGQQNGQGAPGGTKRWKKKFRERNRGGENNGGQQGQQNFAGNGGGQQSGAVLRGPDTHQPGNSAIGFKRKGGFGGGGKQQRNGGGGGGSRGFVGPMDHSYRVANGNVFETPPATIDPYGNGNGGSYGGRNRSYQSDSQPIDYSQGRVIPIAEGTPTKIYFFIDDLFFTAKIQETARKLGVKVAFVKNEKEQIAALTSGEEEDRPGLIVFDLNNANAKPLTLIPKLKAKLKKTTSIIGFLSHIQGDLKAKAVDAGCDTVMPRAAFSQNLPNLLRRYGIEDIEEPNYNQ
jgi:CheY-like chemotaxis protein